MKTKTSQVKFGTEPQVDDNGLPVFAWWLTTVGDGNDEPVAGGFCATEADCRNDATAWLAAHPEFTEA